MGDRSTVTLTVLTSHKKQVEEIIRDFSESPEAEDHKDACTVFTFEEVNYGSLDFLDVLISKGIAYTSEWSNGCEYGSGAENTRFTSDGEAIIKTIYDSDLSIPIDTLMGIINQPEELVELIKNSNEEVQVLPWDNQEEYGKRYKVRRLINA